MKDKTDFSEIHGKQKSPPISAQEHVQRLYMTQNERDVLSNILSLKPTLKTTRKIAEHFGKPVTCADISRAYKGIFPKDMHKRVALGLSPICPVCKRPFAKTKPKRTRGLFDLPRKILAEMLENRQEIK